MNGKIPFNTLCDQIRFCKICEPHLPDGPNPVFSASPSAKLLIAGQAPGIRVHQTGIPFNDPSGDRLRKWMGINKEIFYNPDVVAIVPMGFCYPGTGKSGDLAPRSECALTWRNPLLNQLTNIRLTLTIGQYAQAWHLGTTRKKNLTETVRNWKEYGPEIIPLPHPSPRNNIWLKKNPWFEKEIIPYLQSSIRDYLQ